MSVGGGGCSGAIPPVAEAELSIEHIGSFKAVFRRVLRRRKGVLRRVTACGHGQ